MTRCWRKKKNRTRKKEEGETRRRRRYKGTLGVYSSPSKIPSRLPSTAEKEEEKKKEKEKTLTWSNNVFRGNKVAGNEEQSQSHKRINGCCQYKREERERGNEWFRFLVIFHDTNKTRALEALGPLHFMIITRRAFRLRPITE